MEIELDRIDHLAIPVTDIADAVNWYRKNFSCSITYKDSTWALLEFDNVSLALVLPDQHPAHFAVERDDAARYGSLNVHRDETKSVYIEDPWKNNVEILQINKNE
jgi:extradiol dioxygenase family protein